MDKRELAKKWVQSENPDCETVEPWFHLQVKAFLAGYAASDARGQVLVDSARLVYDSFRNGISANGTDVIGAMVELRQALSDWETGNG